MEHWLIVLGAAAILIIGLVSQRAKQRRLAEEQTRRRMALLSKYTNERIIDDIMNGLVRQGMTIEMVLDSWASQQPSITKFIAPRPKTF